MGIISLNPLVTKDTYIRPVLLNNQGYMYIYVVVNFLSQVIFIFLLFLGMIMYANEV